jgi:predicted nucleic acid-binding protein
VNVVDSSAWLEYFADGPNAGFFAPAIQDVEALLVPAITLLEVFKRVYQQRGESAALQVVAQMQQGRVVVPDATLALTAARLGADLKLPLADSVVLATARHHQAELWTQDADFEGQPGVKFRAKKLVK